MEEGLNRCPRQALWQEEGRITLHLSDWLLEQRGEVLAQPICGLVLLAMVLVGSAHKRP